MISTRVVLHGVATVLWLYFALFNNRVESGDDYFGFGYFWQIGKFVFFSLIYAIYWITYLAFFK